jgi:hypothetical protein
MSFYGFLTDNALSPRKKVWNRKVCLFIKSGMFSMHQLKRNVKGIIRYTIKPLNNKIGKIAVLQGVSLKPH